MIKMNASQMKEIARKRAATHLNIPGDEVEDDLVSFLVSTSGDALLQARAGSGKTTALGLKVSFLTKDLGVDPQKIMMLTFNNAAARSLEERLVSFGVEPGVRIRTFHALGQRIVRSHFGNARRTVFDEKSEDGLSIQEMMQEALNETIQEKFFFFCAGRMRTHYGKRKDYVESVGREALLSAVQFLRARGFGLQNRMENAWEEAGPIAGTAMKVIMTYESKLKDARLLDATSVLQAAAWTLEREIETGSSKPSDAHDIDWVFIDEFQDVSLPYMRLVSAIRELNGMIYCQGVGDSWQAINGFAGADLDYFNNPSTYLEDPEILNLLRNRRSGSDIVAWGNSVMADAGYPKGPAIAHPSNGKGKIQRSKISASRDLRLAAQRLAKLVDPSVSEVALIARKWKVGDHSLPRVSKLVQEYLKDQGLNIKVIGITAHGSKGLEYDQVLLLDDGSFPISHPSRPILEALISEEEFLREEACLKHVAGTRAKRRLDLVDMT